MKSRALTKQGKMQILHLKIWPLTLVQPTANYGRRQTFWTLCYFEFLLGCPASPVINSVFGRLRRKTASRGREDTRVWYRETMFSQMVSYDFLLHEPLHAYFLYLVCSLPEKPTRRCEPEEGYLRCSKRFDHGSNSIIFLLFEFKSVRWCWRWETQRNARVAFKPTRRSR